MRQITIIIIRLIVDSDTTEYMLLLNMLQRKLWWPRLDSTSSSFDRIDGALAIGNTLSIVRHATEQNTEAVLIG
jgi:hypothetical protein